MVSRKRKRKHEGNRRLNREGACGRKIRALKKYVWKEICAEKIQVCLREDERRETLPIAECHAGLRSVTHRTDKDWLSLED